MQSFRLVAAMIGGLFLAGLSRADSTPHHTTTIQEVTIKITEKGFEPKRIRLKTGHPLRLTFVRTTDRTCATEISFPALDLRRKLPLNQPQTIEIPSNQTAKARTLTFACGMDMFSGEIVLE